MYESLRHMKTGYADIVDAEDNIVGCLPRKEAYAQKQLFRIVYIFIIDPDTGHVGLARRAKNLSFRPLHYGTTAVGHVESGEEWDAAACRETHEEIGLTDIPLTRIFKGLGKDQESDLTFMEALYIGWSSPQNIHSNAEEVDSVIFMDVADLQAFAAENPCHPRLADHLSILRNHLRKSPHPTPAPAC